MITKNTVLILGAGASAPYGFPTALELTDIISGVKISPRVVEKMRELHPHFSDVRLWADELCPPVDKIIGGQMEGANFRERLRLSQVYSIDAFLAENEEDRPAGVRAIAEVLTRCEGRFPSAGDWYRELFNRLIAKDGKKSPTGRLTIVTFNYDRSLEWYLFNCYRNYMRQHDDELAWQEVRKIDFIHVYGSLGSIIPGGEKAVVPYGAYGESSVAASQIQLVRSGDKSKHYDRIERALVNADQVAFIGFSFDPLNLDALGVPAIGPVLASGDCNPWEKVTGKMFATSHGLQVPASRHAEERLGHIVWKEEKALEFVTNNSILQ